VFSLLPVIFLLVPKLLLGNEIVFQALLGYVLILSLTFILAKQSLREKGFPSRSLGTRIEIPLINWCVGRTLIWLKVVK
jgi:hypothetical protein